MFALLLALITFSGNVSLAWLYILTAALSITTAIDDPARQSLVPNIVKDEHVENAVSLNTILWYAASTTGPALAGILIAKTNMGIVYLVDALSFGAVIIATLLMRYRGKPASTTTKIDWAGLKEEFKFTYREKMIWSTMLLDFFATFFGSARTMLPIIATEVLGFGAAGYGFLAMAQPIGAVIAGIILATGRSIYRQGAVLLTSVVVYGAATALFGMSSNVVLSYLFFAMTGAGDTVSTVIRGTIRQLMTPNELRGRMTGVNMIFFMGGPQLGELEAGLVTMAAGVSFAVASGGVAVIAITGLIAWKYPQLRRYTSDDFKNASATA